MNWFFGQAVKENKEASYILKIGILEVQHLDHNPNDFLWPSPYVLVKCDDKEVYRTKYLDTSINGIFLDVFECHLHPKSVLSFEVWNKKSLNFDLLLGKVDVPLTALSLPIYQCVEKLYPLSNHPRQKIKVSFQAENFQQSDDEHQKNEKEFEEKLHQEKEKKRLEKIKIRRSYPSVEKYYQELSEVLLIKDIEERSKNLILLLKKVEDIAEKEGKDTSYYNKFQTLLKDFTKFDEISKLGVDFHLIHCLGDILIEYVECLILLDKKETAYQMLKNAEAQYYHRRCSRLLDRFEMENHPNEYQLFEDKKIHIPKKYDKDVYLPKEANKAVIAIFFSWVVYEHNPRWMFRREFDEKYDDRLTGCGKWFIATEFHLQEHGINFHCLFAVNEEHGTVCCAVRGTEFRPSDRKIEMAKGWVTNLNAFLVDFNLEKNIKVHKGFLDQFLAAKSLVNEQIYKYLNAGYRMIITGHSQGAGIATIISSNLAALYGNFATEKIDVYTFGSPRVGNLEFSKYFMKKYPNTERYVASYGSGVDIVTTVPLETMGYHHVGKELLVKVNTKYYGNPKPIKGIHLQVESNNIDSVMSHMQQVYIDGILHEGVQDPSLEKK